MGSEYWAFSITQNNYVHLALCLIQTGCEYWAHHTKTETTTDSHLIQRGSEYWALIIAWVLTTYPLIYKVSINQLNKLSEYQHKNYDSSLNLNTGHHTTQMGSEYWAFYLVQIGSKDRACEYQYSIMQYDSSGYRAIFLSFMAATCAPSPLIVKCMFYPNHSNLTVIF